MGGAGWGKEGGERGGGGREWASEGSAQARADELAQCVAALQVPPTSGNSQLNPTSRRNTEGEKGSSQIFGPQSFTLLMLDEPPSAVSRVRPETFEESPPREDFGGVAPDADVVAVRADSRPLLDAVGEASVSTSTLGYGAEISEDSQSDREALTGAGDGSREPR